MNKRNEWTIHNKMHNNWLLSFNSHPLIFFFFFIIFLFSIVHIRKPKSNLMIMKRKGKYAETNSINYRHVSMVQSKNSPIILFHHRNCRRFNVKIPECSTGGWCARQKIMKKCNTNTITMKNSPTMRGIVNIFGCICVIFIRFRWGFCCMRNKNTINERIKEMSECNFSQFRLLMIWMTFTH